jgi:hypothetical protein
MDPINVISFSLAPFNTARDICNIFKKHKIMSYMYYFSTSFGETIKVGLSNDNEWKSRIQGGTNTWGNRVYKQSLGLNGWTNRFYNGDTSAIEFNDLMSKYYSTLTKNDIIVTVHDMGTKEFLNLCQKEQTLVLEMKENDYLKMYKTKNGQLPVGNVESLKKRGHMKSYLNLFETP